MGNPAAKSPVFVTANYKLSFDALRQELADINAWILVVDTRGINVWCAAGKKTFSTDEVAFQVQRARLADVVSHRELILPQFAATGVASQALKKNAVSKVSSAPFGRPTSVNFSPTANWRTNPCDRSTLLWAIG